MLTQEILASYGLTKINRAGYINFNKNYPCPVCNESDKCGYHVEKNFIKCFRGGYSDQFVTVEGTIYKVFTNFDGSQNAKPRGYAKNTRNRTDKTDKTNKSSIIQQVQQKPEYDIDLTDKFNRLIMNKLSLSDKHNEFAKNRWALNDAKGEGIRTADQHKINQLIVQFQKENDLDGEKIYQIANIVKDQLFGTPRFEIYKNEIMIPFFQNDKLVAWQMRDTSENAKLKYFVSQSVTGNNVFSINSRFNLDLDRKAIIYIDESLTKAIVGANLFDAGYSVGVVGYRNFINETMIESVSEIIRATPLPVTVIIGGDRDTNPNIFKSVQEYRKKLATILYFGGCEHVLFTKWDHEASGAKGIDDAIKLGIKVDLVPFFPTNQKMKMSDDEINKLRKETEDSFNKRNNDAYEFDELNDESSGKHIIRDMILDELLGNHSTVIKSDTGSGKTANIPDIAHEFIKIKESRNDENNNENNDKLLISLANNSLIKEFYNEHIVKAKIDSNEFFCFEGRNESNCNISMLKSVKLAGNNRQNVQEVICKNCALKKDCLYQKQFDIAKNSNIVVSTHATLNQFFSDLSEGNYQIEKQIGNRSHLIADESITDQLIEEVTISYEILHNQRLGLEKELEEKEQYLENFYGKDEIKSQIRKEIDGLRATVNVLFSFEKVIDRLQKQDKKGIYQETYHLKQIFNNRWLDTLELGDLRLSYDYINQASSYSKNRAIHYEKSDITHLVWIYEFISTIYEWLVTKPKVKKNTLSFFKKYDLDPNSNKTDGVEIHLFIFHRDLIKSIKVKSAVILDATANEKMWDRIAYHAEMTPFDFKEIKLKINRDSVKTYYFDATNKTMSGMKKDADIILNQINAFATIHANKTVGVMVTKAVFELIKDSVPSNVILGYYGRDHKGSNIFKGVDIYFMTNYQENITSLIEQYEALTGDVVDQFAEKIVVNYNIVTGFRELKKVTDHDGFNEFLRSNAESTMYQAVQRVRMAHRGQSNQVNVVYAGRTEFWGDQLPPFDGVIENTLENDVKRMAGGLGGQKTKENSIKEFAKKIAVSQIFLNAMGEELRTSGLTFTKKNIELIIRSAILNDSRMITRIVDETGMHRDTIKKHLKNGEFIHFMIGLLEGEGQTDQEQVERVEQVGEKQDQEKSTKTERVKYKVFTIENIIKMIIKALPMWVERVEQLKQTG